jgi:ribonuclease HI
MAHDSIIIFTDGASRGNPGPGGFGAIVVAPRNIESGIRNMEVKELGGREERTTNNRMELTAAISALSFLESYKLKAKSYKLVVYSDSSYLINGITRWIHGWQKNGWKTKAKKDVENRDLWERLLEITGDKEISWKLVAGHVGVAGNTRCDEIATSFADGKPPNLYSGALPNYGIKNILDTAEDAGLAEKKESEKTRSRAKAHSYVSMVDGRVEIHKTWAECETRVKGKAARYKKVFSADEERKLISDVERGKWKLP